MSSSARDMICVHAWHWASEQAATFLIRQVTWKNMQALMHAQAALTCSTYGDKERFGTSHIGPITKRLHMQQWRVLDYDTKRLPCVKGVTAPEGNQQYQ